MNKREGFVLLEKWKRKSRTVGFDRYILFWQAQKLQSVPVGWRNRLESG